MNGKKVSLVHLFTVKYTVRGKKRYEDVVDYSKHGTVVELPCGRFDVVNEAGNKLLQGCTASMMQTLRDNNMIVDREAA